MRYFVLVLIAGLLCLGASRRAARRPVPYNAENAVFNGTNQFMFLQASSQTGMTDQPRFTFSGWIKRATNGQANILVILTSANAFRFGIFINTADRLQILGTDSAGTVLLNQLSTNTITVANGWTHIFACTDLQAGVCKIYLNGVIESTNAATLINGNFDYVGTNHKYSFGGVQAGTDFFAGAMSELWFDDGFFDVPTYFIVGHCPIAAGPEAGQPVWNFKSPAAIFGTQSGTGGTFGVTNAPLTTTAKQCY